MIVRGKRMLDMTVICSMVTPSTTLPVAFCQSAPKTERKGTGYLPVLRDIKATAMVSPMIISKKAVSFASFPCPASREAVAERIVALTFAVLLKEKGKLFFLLFR